MALNIKTVKISFSRIGITTSNTPRRVCYLPMATIKYIDAKKKTETGVSDRDLSRRYGFLRHLQEDLSRTCHWRFILRSPLQRQYVSLLRRRRRTHCLSRNNRCAGSSRRGRFHRQERRHLDNVFCNRRNAQMASSYRRRERRT